VVATYRIGQRTCATLVSERAPRDYDEVPLKQAVQCASSRPCSSLSRSEDTGRTLDVLSSNLAAGHVESLIWEALNWSV